MGDLSSKKASQSVKLTGANNVSGDETNFAVVDGNGNQYANLRDSSGNETGTKANNLQTADVADAGGVSGVIAVANTAIAIRVGASNLANRKRLLFSNVGSAVLYWGYSNAVSGAGNGMPLFRNQSVSDSWGPNTTIWVICPTGSGSLFVGEGA